MSASTAALDRLRKAAASKDLLDVLNSLPPLSAITIKKHICSPSTHAYHIRIGHNSHCTGIYASLSTNQIKFMTAVGQSLGSFQALENVVLVEPFKEVWECSREMNRTQHQWDMRRGWFKSSCVWYWVGYAQRKSKEMEVPQSVVGYFVGMLGAIREARKGRERQLEITKRMEQKRRTVGETEKEEEQKRIEAQREEHCRLEEGGKDEIRQTVKVPSLAPVLEVVGAKRKRKIPTPAPLRIHESVISGLRDQFARDDEVTEEDKPISSATTTKLVNDLGNGLSISDVTRANIDQDLRSMTDELPRQESSVMEDVLSWQEYPTAKRRKTSTQTPSPSNSLAQNSHASDMKTTKTEAASLLCSSQTPEQPASKKRRTSTSPSTPAPSVSACQSTPSDNSNANGHEAATALASEPTTQASPAALHLPLQNLPASASLSPPLSNSSAAELLSDLRNMMTSNFIADVKMVVARYEEMVRRFEEVEGRIGGK